MKLIPVFACLVLVSGCASSPQTAKMEYPPIPKNERFNPDWKAPEERTVLGSSSGNVDEAIEVLETEIRKQEKQRYGIRFVVHYDEK